MIYFFEKQGWISSVTTQEQSRLIYGDGFFESMVFRDGRILFLELHLNRIDNAINALQLQAELDIKSYLLNALQLLPFRDARIRVVFERKTGGYFLPDNNFIKISLTAVQSQPLVYSINNKKLFVGDYIENYKAVGKISNYKTCSSLIYVMAAKFAHKNNYDDCYVSNGNYRIESSNANLFIISNGTLKTPELTQGCVDGIMRNVLIRFAKLSNIDLSISKLTDEDFINADDIILTNVTSVRSVKLSGLPFIEKFISFLNETKS